jgi:hypothetical protein
MQGVGFMFTVPGLGLRDKGVGLRIDDADLGFRV